MTLSPEGRAAVSARMKAIWADPVQRARRIVALRAARPALDRFMAQLDRSDLGGCWVWPNSSTTKLFYAEGRYWKPREFAYHLAFGATDWAVHVGANCHRRCCNPTHLIALPPTAPSPRQQRRLAERAAIERHKARTLADVFWPKVHRRGPDDHWPFLGKGWSIAFFGQELNPRKVAWELTHGPIKPGEHVHGRCSELFCCNPAHSEVMSGFKARRPRALTGDQVIAIRAMYAERTPGGQRLWSQIEIGRFFGVTQNVVSKVVNFKDHVAPLPDDIIRKIRSREPLTDLDPALGLTPSRIYNIRRRATYRHVPDEPTR
jgi:hypothetical protein